MCFFSSSWYTKSIVCGCSVYVLEAEAVGMRLVCVNMQLCFLYCGPALPGSPDLENELAHEMLILIVLLLSIKD